jgi:uncharacterized phage protein (TIGR02218 family)
MKTRSTALADHQAQETTTLAWCWKVTRLDGQVFGFTSCDMDLTIGGVLFEAASGFTPSALATSADLAVDNMEVAGLLDSASLTEADLLVGRWDGAEVEIFEVNWAAPDQGLMLLRTGTLGDVSAGRNAFTAELRGLTQALQQPIIRVYAAACDAALGDARCGVNLAPLTVTSTVTSVANRRTFTDSARAEALDWFGAGLITFTGGANAGLSMEVRDFTAGGVFVMHLPLPYDIAPGDAYTAVPGCRKRRTEDCFTKFNNVINHRGFPDVPLNDQIMGNAGLETE